MIIVPAGQMLTHVNDQYLGDRRPSGSFPWLRPCAKTCGEYFLRACRMGRCKMKALSLGLLLAVTTLSSAHGQRSSETLPLVTVDCYQSFAAKALLPESSSKEIAIDGGNLEIDKTGAWDSARQSIQPLIRRNPDGGRPICQW